MGIRPFLFMASVSNLGRGEEVPDSIFSSLIPVIIERPSTKGARMRLNYLGLILTVFLCCVGMTDKAASKPVAKTLKNPILTGFHPDPSVCRVGEDFYLTNSTFEFFPGLPIYHSRDLVHWSLIGNALDRSSQLPLKGATDSGGLYAPTLRYWKGTFYLICDNVSGGGNFIVTAKDPAGP